MKLYSFCQGFGICLLAFSATVPAQDTALGLFEQQGDVGSPAHAGSAQYDSSRQTYLVAGGGENMWLTNDAFHFVWKKMSGDCVAAANIAWIGAGGNAHRKAGLIIRQSLAPDSPYVDAVVHGDGLTSLQFRDASGGPTREIQANLTRPSRLRLERQGDMVFMSLAPEGGALQPSGCSYRIPFKDPVYVGLAVCAHDNGVLEKAQFSNVQIAPSQAQTALRPGLHCSLEIVPIGSKDRKAIYHTTNPIEAPNWSPDGKFFLFNGQGRIYRLPVAGGVPELVDTAFANRCNNDHGLSPDGTQLAISDQSQGGKSLIYTVPIAGGTPRKVTTLGPSYWHGWSPDGQTLTYCAERNGEFDIYTIPATGGEEKRLTASPGLDDGPEYTADGQYIYFNSDRTGTMQIWRMKADGSQPEQVTSDERNNWFPHPSPDGKWIVFLSYEKGVKGHPAEQIVQIRLMPIGGREIQVLARLFGGQGTINVPSWSPDSRQVAFVSYERY